jgi:hypothetical protein
VLIKKDGGQYLRPDLGPADDAEQN